MNITAAALTASIPAPRTLHNSVPAIDLNGVPILISKDRVLINIRGRIYETYQSTLDRFPDTLLGSEMGRAALYDPDRNALVLDRNPVVFDSILFFYQSRGRILARPSDIPECLFKEEVQFYGIGSKTEDVGTTTISEPLAEDNGDSSTCPAEKQLREKVWKALEYPTTSRAATAWGCLSVAVIIFSVTVFCLETTPLNCLTHASHRCLPEATWQSMEQAVVLFFTLEYVLRLYAAPHKMKFVKSLLALVDLASIIPYYITLIFSLTELPSIYVLRLCRVVRLLKLSRYSTGIKLIAATLSDSFQIMASLMVSILMTVIFFSSIAFYVEDYPGTKFNSIPEGFWWAIVTMTTVGYGDMVPVTFPGKVASSLCAIGGVIFLYILPLPAFVMSFSKRYEDTITNKPKEFKHTPEPEAVKRRKSSTWPSTTETQFV